MTEFQIKVRNYIFMVGVVVAFAVLALQLWNLQVVQGQRYRDLSDANRFRLAPIPASRGVIYDRNGELLVRNRPVYNVVVIPAYLPENATTEAKIFARLSELLNLPITTQIESSNGKNNGYFEAITHHQFNRQLPQQIINPRSRQYVKAPLGIRDAVNQYRLYAPFLPVTIAEDVNPDIIARLEEERITMPGVLIDIKPSRDYMYGQTLSHILGYIGPIPAEQFADYEPKGYDLTDAIGLTGLETGYEEWLRGIKGLESIEVDVTGQKVRTVSKNIEAHPGHNLRLTIDLKLQQATEAALQEEMDNVRSKQGVAIAMNPQNGEILAMVSLPSYDNNLFVQGISPRELARLSEDSATPLVNHAIAGLYPPGSIFKIVTSAGSLQERVVAPETTFFDSGILYLPNRFEPDNKDLAQPFYCWLRTGHGEVNAVAALAWSCNVYYNQVGGGYPPTNFEGLGPERLAQYAGRLGLGNLTGIDLPGELEGLVPDAKWKRLNYAEAWLTGDTYNMSIGQGFVLITPLQMVNAYAAIANGGTLYRPHLVKEIYDANGNVVKVIEPEVLGKLNLDPEIMGYLKAGLRAVVDWDTGTAHKNFDVPGIEASGKTGTAEFCENYPQCLDRDGRVKTSHGWFASYAPSSNPEIVTIAFVYGGGEGSEVAIPITNNMLRHYFNIEDQAQDSVAETPVEITTLPADAEFSARLLGTDIWNDQNASIAGYILDSDGQGLADISVDVSADGKLITQLTTDPTGKFDYGQLNIEIGQNWQLTLPAYPHTPPLQLEIANGLRYLVEFERQPPPQNATSIPALQ
jgi:penicillin-binding protein 2